MAAEFVLKPHTTNHGDDGHEPDDGGQKNSS